MHNALFDRLLRMKTFDVSVNVLNNNVLSDKLLWKESTTVSSSRTVDRPVDRAVDRQVDRAKDQPPEISLQHSDTPSAVCNWKPPELRLERILLMLPFTFLLSFIIVFQFGTTRPLISTLLGCALVLSKPAVLMLVLQKRTCVKNDMYVHILLLHATGLLTILHQKALLSIFVVYVVVFAQLAWQSTGRRADDGKDFKGKSLFYFFIAAVNVVTIMSLLQYNTQSEHTYSYVFSVDVLCVIVVMLSHIVLVAYNYI